MSSEICYEANENNICLWPACIFIGSMRQPYSSLPLLLFKGVIVFLDASGKIVQMKLDTHTHDITLEGLEQSEVWAKAF